MRINITKDSCEFIKNEDKRKTVCIIYVAPDIVDNFIREANRLPIIWNDSVKNLLKIDDKFVGIATCAEEDTWDDETGELVAYTKAKEKFSKAFFRAANAFFDYFDNGLNSIMDECNTLGEAWQNNIMSTRQRLAQRLGIEIPEWEPASSENKEA